jgi:F-type H+-transporting ATPase subunit b
MEALIAAFGLDWKLLLIQGINFGVLLTGLTYFLYTPVMNLIDERRKMVAEGVRSAQEADRVLADSKKEGEGIVGTAAREAEALVAAARARADEKGLELVREAEHKAHAVIADATARAEEAKRQALMESEKEITRAAILAAEKILREKAAH